MFKTKYLLTLLLKQINFEQLKVGLWVFISERLYEKKDNKRDRKFAKVGFIWAEDISEFKRYNSFFV